MNDRPRTARVSFLIAFLLTTCGRPAGHAAFEILSPQERQVLQRDDGGGAEVRVSGCRAAAFRTVEVQAELAGGGATAWEASPSRPLAAGSRSCFEARLRLPAGGWHRLWGRVDHGHPVSLVERVGVGEVFVIAGQSNSTNSGVTRLPAINDRVSAFDGQDWHLAADPIPGVQDGSRGGSPWTIFADRLSRALDLPVAVSPAGFGATSILDWQADSAPVSRHLRRPPYAALRARLAALGPVRAVLWHQGETDAFRGTGSAEYVTAFRNLQRALERDTGRSVRWVVARTSFLPDLPPASMQAIRSAQESLWRDGLALPGPSTDELQGRLRSGDGTHFTEDGLRLHGELWFAAVYAGLFTPRPVTAP